MANTEPQHSSYYRSDSLTTPEEEIRSYLDAEYLDKQPYLHESHPKLLVVFSGGNAVGKSALSKRIQDDLHALILENDAIKAQLMKRGMTERAELGHTTWTYVMDLYQRLDEVTPNGLVVRDAVIDWYFDRILPLFEERGYALFIVRWELSREKSIELVQKRGGKDWISSEKLLELMDGHDTYSRLFLDTYTPDITLDDTSVFDHDRIIEAIRAKLESLQ